MKLLNFRAMAEDLWVSGREPVPFRCMTVIRLKGGGLWLHAPKALDESVRYDLAALGDVQFIVFSSKHTPHAADDYSHCYPDAVFFETDPGGSESFDRAGVQTVAQTENGPQVWKDEIDYGCLAGLNGSGGTIFYHPSSGTMMDSDMLHHLERPEGMMARVALVMKGYAPGLTVSKAFLKSVSNPLLLRESLQKVIAWPFKRVIPGLGQVLESEEELKRVKGMLERL